MALTSYKELTDWQKSIELVVAVYKLTEKFPKSEQFGLTSQMKRCTISIPSNIAEGFTRKSRLQYHQYVRIAFGSGAELETQLIIAKKLNFISDNDSTKVESLLDEVMRMLNRLITSLTTNN